MSLDEALNINPYDPTKGNESAYARYLRYNVDGFYDLDSQVVKDIWKMRAAGNDQYAKGLQKPADIWENRNLQVFW